MYTEIYDSVQQIPVEEWHSLIDPQHDIAMDQRLIYLLEKTLSNQAQFWTVVARDPQHRLMASACLCLFRTDIIQSAGSYLNQAITRLRRRWPNALKLKVLFCGLPLPSGHTHLRISNSADPDYILQLIYQAMTKIAAQEKVQLLVFKEFDPKQVEKIAGLKKIGFIRGELEPLYFFTGEFKNFAEYQQALRSGYRRQVQLNLKKFQKFSIQVEHLSDPETIALRFTEHLHRLYLNVWSRAKEKLECFPPTFFREIAHALPGQVSLTILRDGKKEIAFALGVMTTTEYHNLYIGLDYDYLTSVDLYFNLFYQELEAVLPLQKQKIWLGQTSGAFKSRLGAVADPRFFWVKPLNPLLRMIFKFFGKLIFPKMQPVLPNQVFK